jgi:hypothetical protein
VAQACSYGLSRYISGIEKYMQGVTTASWREFVL